MSFGQHLLEKQIINESILQEGLEISLLTKIKLGRTLKELGFLSQSDLNKNLLEFLSPKKIDSISEFIDKVSNNKIEKKLYGSSIFIRDSRKRLLLSSHFDDELLERLEKQEGSEVAFLLLTKSQWLVFIKTFFSDSKEKIVRNAVNEDEFAYKKMFYDFLEKAKKEKASDVHFEPTSQGLKVRYRVIGELRTEKIIDTKHAESFLTEAKDLSGLPLVVTGKPADGEAKFPDLGLKVRASKLPSHLGDGLCLRINNSEDQKYLNLESMGLKSDEISSFKEALSHKNGVILISGQTGSGKSSTVFSMIMSMNRSSKKIITLEDPIEYECEDMLQLKVNKKKMSFNDGLRSILRHDPDVIIVGEIRDEETAQICFKAAATGHLVISTIHTNDAFNVISRLQMLGITNDVLEENLRMSIAQRLVKKLCQKCSTQSISEIKGVNETTRELNPNGCEDSACISGYENRRQIILQTLDEKKIHQFLKNGSKDGAKNLQEVAIEYAKTGVISYSDALTVS